MMLESLKHAGSLFVTLTYNDDHLPDLSSLVPKHLTNWLKRLRKQVSFRYFAVGEYGGLTWRPHYHAAIFGPEHILCSECSESRKKVRNCQCLIAKTWPFGYVFVGTITKDSAGYVAGYVTKKLTNKKEPYVQEILQSRHPEFSRMSLKPGIGGLAISDIAESLNNIHGQQLIIDNGDVPASLQHGSRSWPLGRYLRSKLREEVGLDAEKVKAETIIRWSAEMDEFYKAKGITVTGPFKEIYRKDAVIEDGTQAARNQEKRFNLFSKKRGIL